MQVTISSKYQIVIPKDARDVLGWKPGQKVEVITVGDHVHLIPVRPMEEMEGFAPGIDTDVQREKEDRV